jgi:hypothetical protein
VLPFFTNPYPDELIYSAIARYHFYSGNIDCKDTLEELFQSRSVIPSVEIGSHFSIFAQQLGSNYSDKNLLGNHTIYAYYAPFLSKQRQKEILQDVQGNGQGLYARLGMIAGNICKKSGLYYCPICSVNDIEQYGEPYIHREHQLQGINYCAHHEIKLRKYPINVTMQSRIKFIRFDKRLMNLSMLQEDESKEYVVIQVNLAKLAYQLLQIPIHQLSREAINLKYRTLLRQMNLISTSNRVRQKELYIAFQGKFPKGFLEKYDSAINVNDEYNWLKVITRNMKRHVHPFRHLLILYFLNQDVENFMKILVDSGPFGKGPWPCLNKAATHYKQPVITNVTITRDYKTNNPIGTFSCLCGFIFARKGPDRTETNRYQIGHVKSFGDVWHKRLRELAKEPLSLRFIARELDVDSKTVKKYLADNEILKKIEESDTNTFSERYRAELLEAIVKFSDYSRTQIRYLFPKQYMYLYRYDQEWLFANLPAKQRKKQSTKTVDWDQRDNEYCNQIKQLYLELVALDKPERITQSLIGKRLGILANLERHLGQLPQTKKLLNGITETIQEYQIRRCCKIIDRILLDNEQVLLWKVQRICAVKSHHFHKIKPQLEAYIQKKQEVKGNEQTIG